MLMEAVSEWVELCTQARALIHTHTHTHTPSYIDLCSLYFLNSKLFFKRRENVIFSNKNPYTVKTENNTVKKKKKHAKYRKVENTEEIENLVKEYGKKKMNIFPQTKT